jgi:hypothetical protein
MKASYRAFASIAAVCAAAIAAPASANFQTGSFGDLTWEARSMIVGVTSTATAAGGGDPRYFADMPKYNGVVALIMDYGAGGRFICSGTLMNNRRSIVTAAHCVSDGAGTPGPLTTTAYFYGGSDPDVVVSRPDLFPGAGIVAIEADNIRVNSAYTGFVIDHNDIAVINLKGFAPSWANSYDLDFTPDLTGLDFNVAGYGGRSDTGGNIGANLGTGRLRQGDNRMEWRVGDPVFAGTTYPIFGPASRTEFSYLSDFDNGLAANDASCRFSFASNFAALGIAGTAKFCDLGRGAMEVGVAGGDSGGPQFIDGKLVSVTSYGITFGTGFFGDIRSGLNSSFGEFSGYVPVYIHEDFITGAATIPEPGTWAMLIAGFGLVGFAARRRREFATTNA